MDGFTNDWAEIPLVWINKLKSATMYIWIFPVVAGVILYVYRAFCVYVNRKRRPSITKGQLCTHDTLPRANRWPLGLDLLMLTLKASDELRLMEFFLDNFRRFGNTFRQVIGTNTSILTNEPANIEALLLSNMKDWGLGFRRTIFFPLLGEGIFLQESDAWKHSRDILRPHFYHRHYENLDIYRPHVDNLVDAIATDAPGIVDLEPLFFRLTLDVTTEFLFSESVWSQRPNSSAVKNDFEDAFDLAQGISAKRLKFQKLYWLVGTKELRKACGLIHGFVDRVIGKTLDGGTDEAECSSRPPFLKTLAQNYSRREALRGQAVNVLVAGRDTTSTFLSWVFYHLLRHPDVMAKLRAEIADIDETVAPLTRADLLRLTYLQNITKEVLRLHPSIPLISRTALRDTTLPTGGGPDGKSPILVPKGMSVLYSAYCIHRRPDLYGLDAEMFRPERWDEEPLRSRDKRWTYLAFGGGPRTCIGMDFSLTNGAYALVRILQRFPTMKLPPGETVCVAGQERQIVTISLRPADGCRVDLSKE
ncbi:cytochrome P450 monooxygenase [Hypoxylon trugodes]|uniref:cytochrome P450 monooxygenase n=1 Tax=Hypoxylon trugodes TaxID=326681 RepID=UPI00219AFD76|nr:cytochrome P450 monooxygenase [Hypoxylon trugodes]KAI1385870.1 cytochrome P450 monooxygenase [Hypoxylon trugodes]